MVSLEALFREINDEHFDGFLDAPVFAWNSRLRSGAGRFIPGSRKFFREAPPKIEVASYLLAEEGAEALIKDTVAHEMIHLWLWVRKKPYGHTVEFLTKMRVMGATRYNPVPKLRGPKYIYRCPNCARNFPARRKLGVLACLDCCKKEADGKFDHRFKLEIVEQLR